MLEDLKPPSRQRGTCKVGIIADRLDDHNRKILLEAVLDAENWPVKTLAKALSDRGLQISDSPIYNHRAKTCVCFRLE
jgi:hypothetical protein